MIGKPYAGKPHVRFDEGELEIEPSLLRQLSTLPRYAGMAPRFKVNGIVLPTEPLLFLHLTRFLIKLLPEFLVRLFPVLSPAIIKKSFQLL